MNVQIELIHIPIEHGFIKEKEIGPFHRHVIMGEEVLRKNIDYYPKTLEGVHLERVLVSRINNLQIFLDIINNVNEFVKQVVTKEEYDFAINNRDKAVAYLELELTHDLVQNGDFTEDFMLLSIEDARNRISFYIDKQTNKIYVSIPGEVFVAFPFRNERPYFRFIREFGTPIEVHLRKHGIIKGKNTIPELQFKMKQIIYYKIFRTIKLALNRGKLDWLEHIYIKKFVDKIFWLMRLYLGNKKGSIDINSDRILCPSNTYYVSNKVIDLSTENLMKVGLNKTQAEAIRSECYNHKKTECINPYCKNTFVPINKNHKRCEKCSDPILYSKEWRKRRIN